MKAIGIAKARMTPRQVGELLALRLQLRVEVVMDLPLTWLALAEAVRREADAAVVVTEGSEVAA